MTYNVFSGTLNPAQSINHKESIIRCGAYWRHLVNMIEPSAIRHFCQIALTTCCYVQDNYDRTFTEKVYGSPQLSASAVVSGLRPRREGPVRVQYDDLASFKTAAKLLGIMDDVKV